MQPVKQVPIDVKHFEMVRDQRSEVRHIFFKYLDCCKQQVDCSHINVSQFYDLTEEICVMHFTDIEEMLGPAAYEVASHKYYLYLSFQTLVVSKMKK